MSDMISHVCSVTVCCCSSFTAAWRFLKHKSPRFYWQLHLRRLILPFKMHLVSLETSETFPTVNAPEFIRHMWKLSSDWAHTLISGIWGRQLQQFPWHLWVYPDYMYSLYMGTRVHAIKYAYQQLIRKTFKALLSKQRRCIIQTISCCETGPHDPLLWVIPG